MQILEAYINLIFVKASPKHDIVSTPELVMGGGGSVPQSLYCLSGLE